MNENPTAVSVYQQDGVDDFPVLKAFQQYIDAEHAKARKRLVTMGIFFVILMGAVIAVFVAMLASLSQRNQQLNDRLVDFAMQDRERQPKTPEVVQRPAADDGMLKSLKDKLDELQKKLSEREAKDEERARMAAEEKQKGPTPEQVEIEKLKALLAAEREKAAAEKERKRQEELEAYRRKHYPELYKQPARKQQQPVRKQKPSRKPKAKAAAAPNIDEIDDVLDLLDDTGAIDYFNDADADNTGAKASGDAEDAPAAASEKAPPTKKEPTSTAPQQEEKETAQAKPPAQPLAIPVDVKKTSGWRIPNE
ncbi:MAG: hypothetical protein IJH50_11665 [Kiritimatiellae bacterium]|nr:hypothetical protein [Kiritimatiellia bacterium]